MEKEVYEEMIYILIALIGYILTIIENKIRRKIYNDNNSY